MAIGHESALAIGLVAERALELRVQKVMCEIARRYPGADALAFTKLMRKSHLAIESSEEYVWLLSYSSR